MSRLSRPKNWKTVTSWKVGSDHDHHYAGRDELTSTEGVRSMPTRLRVRAWIKGLLLLLLLSSWPSILLAEDVMLGVIEFPTSGAPDAGPEFVRGVLYMHSFEYDHAAVAFRKAQAIDPDFAMAYWGEAMT